MPEKILSVIVAIADNNAIGKDNKLLWHLPEDLKRFKRLTTGHRLIMGRNTFLSLPNGPLPNRINTVITNIPDENFEGCEMARSVEEALGLCKEGEESFVIGGGMIYRQFLPVAHRLYLTRVHKSYEADTFFPEIDFSNWVEVYREEIPLINDLPPHSFHIYHRVNKNS